MISVVWARTWQKARAPRITDVRKNKMSLIFPKYSSCFSRLFMSFLKNSTFCSSGWDFLIPAMKVQTDSDNLIQIRNFEVDTRIFRKNLLISV